MLHKKIDLLFAKISLILSLSICLSIPANASDITIEGYITGGVTIALNGDYENGLNLSPVSHSFSQSSTSWLADKNVDFIDFVDDTTTNGFYVTMSITNFTYLGTSPVGTTIPVDQMQIVGKLTNNTPAAMNKGYDDANYNLSILPTSCNEATTDKFTFHSDLTSSNTNYTLIPSNTPQTILTSTSTCLSIGHIRFDKITLTYPADSALGIYRATIVYNIIDGAP